MTIKKFKNRPSTETPINETNLNVLVDAINEINKDTGWLNIPMASGFTGDGFQYRRYRGVVYIKGIARGTFWKNTYTFVGTLPVGFRPPSNLINGAGLQGGYGGFIEIKPNGEISFNHQIDISLGWASSTLCFMGGVAKYLSKVNRLFNVFGGANYGLH